MAAELRIVPGAILANKDQRLAGLREEVLRSKSPINTLVAILCASVAGDGECPVIKHYRDALVDIGCADVVEVVLPMIGSDKE